MTDGPNLTIVAGRHREVSLTPVTDESRAEFEGRPMLDSAVHEALLADLEDPATVAWTVMDKWRGWRGPVSQTAGIVALSRLVEPDAPKAQELDFYVWYGGLNSRRSLGPPAGRLAVAAVTGYGLQLHENLLLMSYRLTEVTQLSQLAKTWALGYTYLDRIQVGGVTIRKLAVSRADFSSTQATDPDYVSLALGRLGKRYHLTPDTPRVA